MHLHCINGKDYCIGDSKEKFSIQSISKVFSLALAKTHKTKIWHRVDVEPSGNPFNSLIQLDQEKGIPRNPFINSGALVIADILVSCLKNPKEDLLDFVRYLAQDEDIYYDEKVAASEKSHGYRNIALVNYMKSLGNINNDVDDIIDFYFYQCSIAMSCSQPSKLNVASSNLVSRSKASFLRGFFYFKKLKAL